MNAQSLALQDLVRQAVIKVAQLPEKELLVVIEMIDVLKKQPAQLSREQVEAILEKAKARASELSHLSHAELVQRFIDATERVRADAIEKGIAIEGEWESD